MGGTIPVGIVGTKFMGRAHSNAYAKAPLFFDLPLAPVMRAACGRNAEDLAAFAARFGWETTETRWERLLARDDIELVDICTPNVLHAPIAIAAALAGKHILCEKPLAMNATEARAMLDAARDAGVKHMVAFNYRRVPAVVLAKRLIEQGKIGRIVHFDAVYYQDWLVDPQSPYVWRHDASRAGSGAHGDMHAHLVDLARYLVGDIAAVCGAQEVFIKERQLGQGQGMAQVTADDATYFLARFRDGALGSFLATRLATGRKNYLHLEIYGTEGSLVWNLERLNELQYYSRQDAGGEQGFRTILATQSEHPYVSAWWPPGHVLGWEHTFVHEVADLMRAIHEGTSPAPDFSDGLRCQQVLDAVIEAAREGTWVDVHDAD